MKPCAPGVTDPCIAPSKVEVTGIDVMATFNQYLASLKDHLESTRQESRERQAKEAAARAYETSDTVGMKVFRKFNPLTNAEFFWGYAVEGLPSLAMAVSLQADSIEGLLHETRFLFGQAMWEAKVEPTRDACMRRAARCVVGMTELVVE